MDEISHIIGHAFEHTIADTLYLIPFLFVTYVAMEWLEHRTGGKTQEAIKRAGTAGPFVGALLGAVPQCGFSVAAATLYAGRVITLGTLFAVFLSTSDEMLPIFIAEQVPLPTILRILGTKIVIGMVMGFLVDAALRLMRRDEQDLRIHELCEHDGCGCVGCGGDCAVCEEDPKLVYEHYDAVHCEESEGALAESRHGRHHDEADHHEHSHGHAHDHSHDGGWKSILKSALIHTLQVTLFIFLITLALDLVLEVIGEDALGAILGGDSLLSIALSALVGVIPNCAASVVIAQLYLDGILGAGAMMAGLLVSAGVGFLVLVRTNRHWKQNVWIICGMYATGVVWGVVIALLGITF